MDRGNKTTNVVDQEVSDHGFNDGLKEGTVGHASMTNGDVPSSSNSTVGWTEGATTINITNSDDVSIVSPNPSGSSNVQTGIPTVNTGPISLPSSYATKLSPTSLTKANLRKLEVNAPNDADYDVWLPLASVHEMIRGIPIFLNKWSPFMSLLKEELTCVPVWVKFHDVSLFTCTLDGLGLIAMKIALNVVSPIIEEVASIKATTSSMQEEQQRSTPLVERIHIFEKQILEGNLVLVDDDGKPVENIDYPGNIGSEDEVEQEENETTNYLASKPKRVGYGLKILLYQWREKVVDDEYDPFDNDMYEGQEIPDNIQSICDNLDIYVRGRKKK
ncbi:ribonuclease H-like domain-containing protein [Tanacetum coccineum]